MLRQHRSEGEKLQIKKGLDVHRYFQHCVVGGPRSIHLLWTTIPVIIRPGIRVQGHGLSSLVWIKLRLQLAPALGLGYNGWQFGP